MIKIRAGKNKIKILALIPVLIVMLVLATSFTFSLPLFYDENTEAFHSAIIDPRIPGWYPIYDWEVKYCMTKKGLDETPPDVTASDTENYGEVVGAYAYKTRIPNPLDPEEELWSYEISYFLMVGEAVEFEVQLVSPGTETIITETCSDYGGCADYRAGNQFNFEEEYSQIQIKYDSQVQFKGEIVEKEETY